MEEQCFLSPNFIPYLEGGVGGALWIELSIVAIFLKRLISAQKSHLVIESDRMAAIAACAHFPRV